MKSSDLPKDLLPFAPRRSIKNPERSYDSVDIATRQNVSYSLTKGKQLTLDMQATCRRAYHFICSAFVECSSSILIYADDIRQAQRWARDNGWSTLQGLGWCCHPCALVYHSSRNGVGPRKKTRTYRQALSSNDQVRKRLTVQELWEQQLEQNEPRGNDLAERRGL